MARPKRSDKKAQRHTVLLRPDLWAWLEQQAATAGQTVNEYIEAILKRHHDATDKENNNGISAQ